MKLWAMPCRATQDMVQSSDKMWCTGEGNGKSLQYSCLENPMNNMKRQKDRTLKDELPRSVGAQYATWDQWRNNSRNNEDMEPKQNQQLVVDVTISKFRLKLKKVGKTARPFRYDLNQIPYDYTVEVRNRLKGQDLIDRVPDELWTDIRDIVQETGIKIIPKKKKCKKAKWLSEEVLQIAVKRREVKSKGEKERYMHLNAEFQRLARRDKKAFLSDQCKEIEENNRIGKTRDFFKKVSDTKVIIFHAKMGTIKDRNGMDLTKAKDIKKR